VDTVRNVRELIAGGEIEDYESIRHVVEHRTRDNARTPMQWSDEPHAGFTEGEPWIPVNDNYPEINVAGERERTPSVLTYYETLIDLRDRTEALVYGDYDLHRPDDEQLFVYARTLDDERVVVVINFSPDECSVGLDPVEESASLLLSNYETVPDAPGGTLDLRPYETRLYGNAR
jgi:glycosidase